MPKLKTWHNLSHLLNLFHPGSRQYRGCGVEKERKSEMFVVQLHCGQRTNSRHSSRLYNSLRSRSHSTCNLFCALIRTTFPKLCGFSVLSREGVFFRQILNWLPN